MEGRTNVTELPSALRQLMKAVSDAYTVVAEHPRPGDLRPPVWEIHGPAGERWFAKQHAGPKLHRREVDAYRKWTVALGSDRAPELVSSDVESRAILVTGVPGLGLDTLRLPADQETKAYKQAGELLARLHTSASDEPSTGAPEEAWEARVAKQCARAARYVPQHDLALVRALTEHAPARLPCVAAHGDYMPKNWLWDESEQRLRIIDFERAELQPAVQRDLSRLHYRVLRNQPSLDAAFHHGYGRLLSVEEQVARRAYAALDALDSLSWGIEHRDLGLVDEAHTMLENLRLEDNRQVWGGWSA